MCYDGGTVIRSSDMRTKSIFMVTDQRIEEIEEKENGLDFV